MLHLRCAAPLNFLVTWQWCLTFSSSWSINFLQIQQLLLYWNKCSSFSFMIKFLLKCFFHYFFIIFILFKNWFNKFISSIFTSINNNWLNKSIINTNNFVRKTTRNKNMIFLCKNIHELQQFLNYIQNQHKFKWNC